MYVGRTRASSTGVGWDYLVFWRHGDTREDGLAIHWTTAPQYIEEKPDIFHVSFKTHPAARGEALSEGPRQQMAWDLLLLHNIQCNTCTSTTF